MNRVPIIEAPPPNAPRETAGGATENDAPNALVPAVANMPPDPNDGGPGAADGALKGTLPNVALDEVFATPIENGAAAATAPPPVPKLKAGAADPPPPNKPREPVGGAAATGGSAGPG